MFCVNRAFPFLPSIFKPVSHQHLCMYMPCLHMCLWHDMHANLNTFPLMLLVCSVNTPIHTHRFHFLCIASCVLCKLKPCPHRAHLYCHIAAVWPILWDAAPFTQDAEHLVEGTSQAMGHIAANGSVHTGCTQHQRVCVQICMQICLHILCELGLFCHRGGNVPCSVWPGL